MGLESAEFCTAVNLERDTALYRDAVLKKQMRLDRFWFHAPFAELSPAAVDPRVREGRRCDTVRRFKWQPVWASTGWSYTAALSPGLLSGMVCAPICVILADIFGKSTGKYYHCPGECHGSGTRNVGGDRAASQRPRLGLCLDVGHANCRISETPPLHWIEPMLPFLYHVHLHNNAGDMDLHAELGSGTVPMETILDILLARRPEATLQSKTKFAARRWYGCGNEAICPIRSAGRQLHK